MSVDGITSYLCKAFLNRKTGVFWGWPVHRFKSQPLTTDLTSHGPGWKRNFIKAAKPIAITVRNGTATVVTENFVHERKIHRYLFLFLSKPFCRSSMKSPSFSYLVAMLIWALLIEDYTKKRPFSKVAYGTKICGMCCYLFQ